MVDPLDRATATRAKTTPSGWAGVLLGFVFSLAYVELLDVLRVWFRWPGDRGVFDYIWPWVPIPIFLLCVRRVPSWLQGSYGRREAFVVRFIWCVVLGLISLVLIYILLSLFSFVMPPRHYLSRP